MHKDNKNRAKNERIKNMKPEYDPEKNPDAISIIRQQDGNWMGWMQKNGKMVEAREIKPEDVLLKLITHE